MKRDDIAEEQCSRIEAYVATGTQALQMDAQRACPQVSAER